MIHPGYVVSAKHGGLQSVSSATFGYDQIYKIVDNNLAGIDFSAPRLNKLVTEVIPADIQGKDKFNNNRYTAFTVRALALNISVMQMAQINYCRLTLQKRLI